MDGRLRGSTPPTAVGHDPAVESPASSDPDSSRAAEFWNERHLDPAGEAHDNFLNHPLIQAYISLRAFGTLVGHLDVVGAEIRSRTQPGDRIVSVGCGRGDKERALARLVPDRRFLGIDIAADIVATAQRELAAAGVDNLQLRVGDFNHLELERGEFAAVLGLGAIHHVEQLEAFWTACAEGLTRDGVVLAQEFVGPDRFQWTDAQIAAGDRALRDIVPERKRPHHDRIERTPVEEMIRLDPSEAVRSSQILATCKAAGFTIDGYAGAGCALLQPVLMNQIAAFDPRDWEDNHVLATLFREEDRLMRAGELGDDFAMFVARPARDG